MAYSLDDVLIERESASGKAVLIDCPLLDDGEWVPKSVITDDSEVWKEKQDRGTLIVEEWFAKKKGWPG